MKFLLIGQNNFFYQKLIKFLLERDQEIIIYNEDKFETSRHVEVITDDFKNIKQYTSKLSNVDYTIFSADFRNDTYTDETTLKLDVLFLQYAINIINFCSPSNKVIFFSNISVYENHGDLVNEAQQLNPSNLYSKFLYNCEEIIRKNFENYFILRTPTICDNTYVDKDNLIFKIIDEIKNKRQVLINNENYYESFIDIGFIFNVFYYLINKKLTDKKTLNIGKTANNITRLELLKKIETAISLKIDYTTSNSEEPNKPKVDYSEIEDILKYLNITFFENFDFQSIEKIIYELFLNKKVVFALEEYDSILKTNRPNGSSKTWYLEEEGALDYPKMWGRWNLIQENESNGAKIFPKDVFESQVLPNFYREFFETKEPKDIFNDNYVYLINVFDPNFFVRNKKIGFSCISKKYLDDAKIGKCKIILALTLEGYSACDGNHDLEIIQDWIIASELPFSSVYYISANLIIKEVAKQKNIEFTCIPISCFDTWINYEHIKKLSTVVSFEPDDKEYLFLSYNRAPRNHRIELLSRILDKNLLHLGKVSLNTFWLDENTPENHPVRLLHKLTPLLIDRTLEYNLANVLEIPDYNKTFMSIVTETLTDRNTLFLSEKIWKPISCGHPFMVLGNKGTLKKLKEFGFKTYDRWFDESYDDVDDMYVRADLITNEIEKYKNKSIDELKEIRNEMKETCEYNRKYFIKYIKNKYTFNGVRMDTFKEFFTIINQINLNII